MIRILLILCEGLTEKIYFDMVVRRRRVQTVKVEVIGRQGSHEALIDRCMEKREDLLSSLNLEESDVETWAVCDHDNYRKSFTKLLQYANDRSINLAYSKHQFETYLIQHLECRRTTNRGAELEKELSDLLGFKYEKNNLDWLDQKIYEHPKILETANINSDNFHNHTRVPFLTVQDLTRRLLEFEL